MAAPKIVVPDHGEIWCRQESRRHVETIDISCIAQFITHQEISPKNASYTLNKYIVMRTSGITAIPPLNFAKFDLNFLPRICTQMESLPFLFSNFG